MERSRQRADADARLRDFGRWLRLLRQSRQLSQEQLGDRAGIDRAVIGRIERGEVNVGIAYLWQLADALEIRGQALLPADDHPLLRRESGGICSADQGLISHGARSAATTRSAHSTQRHSATSVGSGSGSASTTTRKTGQ